MTATKANDLMFSDLGILDFDDCEVAQMTVRKLRFRSVNSSLKFWVRLIAVFSLLTPISAVSLEIVSQQAAGASVTNTNQPTFGVNPTNKNQQYVFWEGSNGNIYERWYVSSSGTWAGPKNLGWQTNSAPSVAVDDSGNQFVVWTYGDAVYEATNLGSGWTGPTEHSTWNTTLAPSVGVNPTNDYQYIFWQNGSGDLEEGWNNGGSGWSTKTFTSTIASSPSVSVTNSGGQYVFWQGSNGFIYEDWYTGSWYGPQEKTWSDGGSGLAPSVSVNPSNSNQSVFWIGSNGHIWDSLYTGTWSTAADLGWQSESPPESAMANTGEIWVTWQTTNSDIALQWNSTGSWQTTIDDTGVSETIPVTTTTYYEETTSTSALKAQGELAATTAVTDTTSTDNGLIILDFGQADQSGSTYGTYTFGNVFASFSTELAAAEAFADGYESLAPPGAISDIAIGANNGIGTPPGNFTSWGDAWATTVESFESYVGFYPNPNVEAAAGYDAEPAYDSGYTDTFNALTGFNGTASIPLYDDGSLDGGIGSIWTAAQDYQATFGFSDDYPVPEIYNTNGNMPTLASEWEGLASWAYANETAMIFPAIAVSPASDEAAAFNQFESDLGACGCGDPPSVYPIPLATFAAYS